MIIKATATDVMFGGVGRRSDNNNNNFNGNGNGNGNGMTRRRKEAPSQATERYGEERKEQQQSTVVSVGNVWSPSNAKPSCVDPTISNVRLLVLSHGKIVWYFPASGKTEEIIHLPKARFRGVLPFENKDSNTLWVAASPLKNDNDDTIDFMYEIELKTGKVVSKVKFEDVLDIHDVIRDGNVFYAADTRAGNVQIYKLPKSTDLSLKPVQTLNLYTRANHINTLAISDTHLYTMLHNSGIPATLKILSKSEKYTIIDSYLETGRQSHGIAFWGDYLITLDSKNGKLVQIHRDTHDIKVLWTSPNDSFLKGLAVVDGVVYFSLSPPVPTGTERLYVKSKIMAFDLCSKKQLSLVDYDSDGLINHIASPEYLYHYSSSSSSSLTSKGSMRSLMMNIEREEESIKRRGEGHKNNNDNNNNNNSNNSRLPWPGIPISWKNYDLTPGLHEGNVPDNKRYVPLSKVDVSAIQKKLKEAGPTIWEKEGQMTNAFLLARESNQMYFKPGVKGFHLIFSDRSGRNVYEYPWWKDWKPIIQPLLEQIFGPYYDFTNENHIVRLQFAHMGIGSAIKKHVDSGPWVQNLHRVHIPVLTNNKVEFRVKDSSGELSKIHVEEGESFELNNAIPHLVDNFGSSSRVHILIDFSEQAIKPSHYHYLKPGQECSYQASKEFTCN